MDENLEMQEMITEEASASSAVASSNEKKESWGEKRITRKVFIIGLAAAVFLNVALAAGVMALFSKHNAHDRPEMFGNGRPDSEMFSDNFNGNGKMMPPGNMPGQQNNAPDQQSGSQGSRNGAPAQQNNAPDQQSGSQNQQNNAPNQQNNAPNQQNNAQNQQNNTQNQQSESQGSN